MTERQITLPEEYSKPMMSMLSRFTGSAVSPGSVASPAAVAVAVAVVIVIWDRPLDELILTSEEKESLRYAAQQIRENPKMVKDLTGVELTRSHVKLLEAIAL
jgi:hypothetical protein